MSGSSALRDDVQRLFEQGDYPSCLDLLRTLPAHGMETRLRIIESVCLFCTGSLDEAELSLRDLKSRVPDSADVCFYLGKTLEARGDEGARAEYAAAVRLNPDHPEAIRRYAFSLASAGDYSAAAELFRRLFMMTGLPDDLSSLMECDISRGQQDVAIEEFRRAGSPDGCFLSFLDALAACERYHEIVRILDGTSRQEPEGEIQSRFLNALARVDPDRADQEYLSLLRYQGSEKLAVRYFSFLSGAGKDQEALGVWSTWCGASRDPGRRLLAVPLLVSSGKSDIALRLCEEMLFDIPPPESPDLSDWYSLYGNTLKQVYGREKARGVLLSRTGSGCHPFLSLMTAGFCEDLDDHTEAKHHYYQAFRSDLITGGLSYAAYLGRTGDIREQEKILGYILKTVRKVRDLESVTRAVLACSNPDRSLISLLVSRLSADVRLLSTAGRDLYARALCLSAERSLADGSPDKGTEECITGLAVVPVESVDVAESLFAVLISCKRQTLPDHIPSSLQVSSRPEECSTGSLLVSFPWLEPAEEAVVIYLRKHRICHELDLRKVAHTRRVAGMMNRIMRKSADHGMNIVEKEGYSEFGEVYRYAGP